MANKNEAREVWLTLIPDATILHQLYIVKSRYNPFCQQKGRWNNHDFETAENLKDLSWVDDNVIIPFTKLTAQYHKSPESARAVVHHVQDNETRGARIFSLHINLLTEMTLAIVEASGMNPEEVNIWHNLMKLTKSSELIKESSEAARDHFQSALLGLNDKVEHLHFEENDTQNSYPLFSAECLFIHTAHMVYMYTKHDGGRNELPDRFPCAEGYGNPILCVTKESMMEWEQLSGCLIYSCLSKQTQEQRSGRIFYATWNGIMTLMLTLGKKAHDSFLEQEDKENLNSTLDLCERLLRTMEGHKKKYRDSVKERKSRYKNMSSGKKAKYNPKHPTFTKLQRDMFLMGKERSAFQRLKKRGDMFHVQEMLRYCRP